MAKALNVSLAVTADTSQAKAQLQQLQNTLQQLTANSANLNLGINANEIAAASKAALELSAHLKQATDINTGTLNFTKFESSIRHSGQTIEGLGSQLMSLGPQGQQAFNQLAQAVAKSEIPMKKISGMLGQFGTVIGNTIRWQASSSIIHGIMGSIQGAYNYAQDLNKSLNNIQIVTQMSNTQMSKFAESANKAAKALSTTTTSYTDAALIYYQQGIRDQNEINERTSATIKMANVTGQSAEKVSNQMTAIWNNFAKGGQNLEYYADVITALGAATASSSEEISKGLEKFAATADTVGLSYENATAALATITATTRQSADSVGTGLRTLFARLDSLKLGETLEDGVDLTKYTKALQSVGVQVLDTNGNLKRMDDILDELGAKWNSISDTQKVALAQTVGGVRQYTTLMALMNNFGFYKENIDIAKNSEGTLQRQQDIYEKSWAASSKRVRAAMETIFSTVINDQFFINLNNGFAQFLDIINNVIKGLGGMKGLLLGLGGVLGQVFSPQITQGLYKFGMGFADIFTSGKASQEARSRTISNLAGIIGGGTYNAKTGLVEGANPEVYSGYSKLINNQAKFAENAALMAPWQRQYAQMVFDNQQRSILETQQAQQNVVQARRNAKNLQYDVFQQTRGRTEEYIQEQMYTPRERNRMWLEAMSQAREEGLSGQMLDQRAAALYTQSVQNYNPTQRRNQLLTQRNQDINNALKEYANLDLEQKSAVRDLQRLEQNSELLNKITGQSGPANYTESDLDFIEGLESANATGLLNRLSRGEDIGDLIAEASSQNAPAYEAIMTKMQDFGIETESKAFQDWRAGISNASTAEIEQKIKEFQQQMAEEQGKDVADLQDKEVTTAQKITSVTTGLMQAAAAGQSLQNVVGVFDQINNGSISASEGIAQLATGLTATATQGMMAFNSLSSVLGGFGGALATIAMVSLPYIIEAFDGLFESDKERQERYAQYTELAQEQLTNAKTSYQELLSGFETHDSLLDELSKLTKGTIEFEEALSKANTEAENLIDKYDLSQTAGDYYYDQNGAIQFSKRTQERLETEAKKEIADAEIDALQAQYTEALNKYQTNQDILDNMSAQYNRNSQLQAQGAGKSDKAFYAQYDELAKSLGYSSGEQLYQLYTGGKASEVQTANYFKSGISKTYAAMNRNKALSDDGLISDIEALQNTYLESQQAQHLEDVANLVPNRIVQVEGMDNKWSNTIDLANVSWTHALGHFEAAYEALAGSDKLAELQNDIAYQQKSTKDKKILLASLIQAEDQRKKLQEIQDKYTIEWDQARLKEFEGYKKKKGTATQKLKEEYNKAIKNLAEGKGSSTDLTTLAMTQAMIQEQAQSLSNLAMVAGSLPMAGFSTDEFIQGFSQGLYSIEDINILANYTSQFANTFGEQAATAIFTSLKDSLKSNSKEFLDVLEDIDFSKSSISSLFNINKQLKENSKLSEDTRAKLVNLGQSILMDIGGTDGLVSELLNSDEFSDTFKSLTKNVKSFGDITAQSILEAADSCDILNEFFSLFGEELDTNIINAQGLASALELVSLGELDASQITSGLLAALSAAGQLDQQLAEVYKHFDDYGKKRSAADIGGFYSDRVADIRKSMQQGIFGDAPLLQAMTELFGSKTTSRYIDWGVRTSGMPTKERQANWTNEWSPEIRAMQSILERNNLSGMYEYAFNTTQGNNLINTQYKSTNRTTGEVTGTYNISNEKGQIISNDTNLMHYDDKTQQLVIDNMEQFQAMFGSVNDLADFLESNLGITHDMAQAMAAEAGQYNLEVQTYFKQSDIQAGQDELIKAAQAGTLTMDQVEAFQKKYAAFDEEIAKSDWAETFVKQCIEAGGSVINLGKNFDYASTNFEDLKDKLGGEEGFQNYLKNKGVETQTITKTIKRDIGDDSLVDRQSWSEKGKKTEVENGRVYEVEEVSTNITNLKALQKAMMDLGYSADQANAFIAENKEQFGELGFVAYDTSEGIIRAMDTSDDAFLNWYKDNKDGYSNMVDAVEGYIQAQEEARQAAVTSKALADALGLSTLGTTMETLSSTIASLAEALAGLADGKTEIKFGEDGAENVINQAKTIKEHLDLIDRNISIKFTSEDDTTTPAHPASGINNAKGFAGGYHSNNDYQGIAETGELGPELWIHNGQPALTGVHGRNKIFVSEGDQIFTAAQTREILRNNPSLQDIPRYNPGTNNSNVYIGFDPLGKYGASGVLASNKKTNDFEPERYHLITRQLKDLQREYDRLNKLKEECYGTNKLEAIQREIDATNELLKAQQALVDEANEYLKMDAQRLKSLLDSTEWDLDTNGQLKNFEKLQEKYRKAAEVDKDEKAQEIWKALQQYEETLDKVQDANTEMQNLLYQEMELRLEKITTKAELKIAFDEREIKLLDHYIKRIDDNIYHTAEVLALTEQRIAKISEEIEHTKDGIAGIFEELSDSKGNKIVNKDTGKAYTLDEWLALTNEERDLLDINDNFGKQLEEYMDNILDYIEELEEFKTKGVEEFGEAFDELNDNVRSSIDLFDHYNQLLSSLKNITDLQGIKLSAQMKETLKVLDNSMFANTQNNIDAERENYRRLTAAVAELQNKIANTNDEVLKKQWEEQLKTAEEQLRTSESNMLQLWEQGLQQANDMFEQALDDAATEYEEAISGMYGSVEGLQRAWDQAKRNDEFYAKDYEKYYQISKLQRSITKDLDAAARSGGKQSKGLKKLYDELNDARENGVELSEYDLDIYAKRYEYEKALMELEDARNNKSEVRLQRDANGNWGYVYTSAADDDDLIAKQQAVDDKFYELQKATQNRIASLSDDMMKEITGVGQTLAKMRREGASSEAIDDYLAKESEWLAQYREGLAKALEDAGMTEEEARQRYGNAGFDILNQFGETLLSDIYDGKMTLDEFFENVGLQMYTSNALMDDAKQEQEDRLAEINKWFNETGQDLAEVIKGFAEIINEDSAGNLLDSKKQIQNAKDTFSDILNMAMEFEEKFMDIYQPIIDENERLVADLLKALSALNHEEHGNSNEDDTSNTIGDVINSYANESPSTGTDTGSDSGKGSGSGGGNNDNIKVVDEERQAGDTPRNHVHYIARVTYVNGKWKKEEATLGMSFVVEKDNYYECTKCNRKWLKNTRRHGGCFAPGTKILMSDLTTQNIENIKIDDIVMAYDENAGIFIPKRVIQSYAHYHTLRMINIYLSNGIIMNMTPGHPIMTTTGWKSLDVENSLYEHGTIATLLQIGDIIIGVNEYAFVVGIEEEIIDNNYTSYNIEVEDCHTFLANGFVVHNAKVPDDMIFASGGYTGHWGNSEGRLAMLHEKELVLNKDDTSKFLNATQILRTIDLQSNLISKGLGNIMMPVMGKLASEGLEQNVHIEASFPNAVNHNEIELAFDNLINKASQYANRKNMSSMTFQDMYTSKF